MGAASFELPWAFSKGGLVGSMVGVLGLALMSSFSLGRLAECPNFSRCGSTTYPELGREAFGDVGFALAFVAFRVALGAAGMAHLAVRPEHGRPIWRVAAYLMRGCGSLRLTSTRGYSAADPEDLAAALQAVKERYPEAPIAAAGFSLGGNLLVKYLARAGASTTPPSTSGLSVRPHLENRKSAGIGPD